MCKMRTFCAQIVHPEMTHIFHLQNTRISRPRWEYTVCARGGKWARKREKSGEKRGVKICVNLWHFFVENMLFSTHFPVYDMSEIPWVVSYNLDKKYFLHKHKFHTKFRFSSREKFTRVARGAKFGKFVFLQQFRVGNHFLSKISSSVFQTFQDNIFSKNRKKSSFFMHVFSRHIFLCIFRITSLLRKMQYFSTCTCSVCTILCSVFRRPIFLKKTGFLLKFGSPWKKWVFCLNLTETLENQEKNGILNFWHKLHIFV